ncbi:MAG: lysine exporter LysO family protein [Bacteroidaceae bacterium]|nr:lysine exporter LysO family protein [Bacteroidaceae bacterium]
MRGSIIIFFFFITGALTARMGWLPATLVENDFSIYVLYGLMFLVGMSIGSDTKVLRGMKRQKATVVLVPLATLLGTLAGCAAASFLLPGIRVWDSLAVGSGFAYYSLSSVFITELRGAELGTVALIANVTRELFTLMCAPLLVRWFGKLAPICSGGATTMDTTLPVIVRFSGKEFVVVSIFHGFVTDFSVPFLVTFFCRMAA